ncbi:hypothetical protein GVO57_07275 [Sphingomonas changnyeongensis]|uniref:Right handed beta helix domain-containing protein n=1 Tax=Sphingomonas changnyeongensis TaxID=2698679 RepID=A0A7Z2NVN2_9SPHN|nr:right-handed parallel beta-helix repeat-containing protein [Sphingomonas changnyeongensis]QHL90668.1 hypothetical protein GVO57_07275 [Sphingomonas changnyeongensis]
MRITTAQDLAAALRKCVGGEHIESAAPLTGVSLHGYRFPVDKPVRITGHFRADQRARNGWTNAVEVHQCASIEFVDSHFEAVVVSEYERYARGLYVERGERIALRRCRLGDGNQGALINRVDGLAIEDCDFANLGNFGLQGAVLKNFVLRRNIFRGFHLAFDPTLSAHVSPHGDAVQLMAVPGYEEGCERGLFEDNLIFCDPDNKVQGIYFQDLDDCALRAGRPHRDIHFKRDILLGAGWDALALDVAGGGLVIEDVQALMIQGGRPAPSEPPGGQQVVEARINIARKDGAEFRRSTASRLLLPGRYNAQVEGFTVSPQITLAQADQIASAWLARHRKKSAATDPLMDEIARLTAERGDLDAQRAAISRRIRQIDSRLRTLRRQAAAPISGARAV